VPDRLLSRAYRLVRKLNAGARLRTVATNDGRLWPVYHTLPPTYQVELGVPLVFFHGFGNDGSTWFPFMSALGATREVASPDLPGFGRHSLGPGETPTPDWYQNVTAELLRELTVRWGQPPIVIGKSMGGLIAGLVAGELPHLVRKLVLIDPAGIETPVSSPFWDSVARGENPLLPRDDREWDRMIDLLYYQPPRVPGFLRREALRSIVRNYETYQSVFEGLLSEGFNPLGDRLHRITCPVCVVWGAEDRVMDVSGVDVIRAAIPSASVHVLPRCGHSPARERSAELNRILTGVISRWG
jgi:pimeloyl-ACP methyl ester carboxylesterase